MDEMNNNAYGIPPQQPVPPKKNPGMAIAALVLGIVSVALSCCYYLSIPCAILAIIFGILVMRKGPEGKGFALAGIICGAITVVLVIIFLCSASVLLQNFPEIYDYYEYFD